MSSTRPLTLGALGLAAAALLAFLVARPGSATPPSAAPRRDDIESVVLHPIVHPHFVCLEHPAGQLTALGDALGSDCMVVHLAAGPTGRFPAFFRGSGERNEDWYGWREVLLAPFGGVVDSVIAAPPANRPGHLARVQAGVIFFRRVDGLRVIYAHVREVRVRAGDSVRAGQPVARVGNNGPAYFPHTHVGAWRGGEPLQIRWDLVRMGTMSRRSQAGSAP